AAPKIIAAAMKGDDALLRAAITLFEKEGFRVAGTAEAAPDLLMPSGTLGKHQPNAQQKEDVTTGVKVVRTLGRLDVGQAVAVCDGLVLVVEAAEGTDAMLARITQLPANIRGSATKLRGVLVKAPKPAQDRRLDLPVIGGRGVERAAQAGLAGIAIEAGSSIVMHRERVGAAANKAGLFVIGFDSGAYPQ